MSVRKDSPGTPNGSWAAFLAAHRAQVARDHAQPDSERVVVLGHDAAFRRWIEHEVFGEHLVVEFVAGLHDLVASLTLLAPPWPEFLIIDADAISQTDVNLLSAIKEAGWSGMIVVVGDVSRTLQRSIAIEVVLPRTMDCELLRNTFKHLRSQSPTTNT